MTNNERKPIKIDIKHDPELTDDKLTTDTGELTEEGKQLFNGTLERISAEISKISKVVEDYLEYKENLAKEFKKLPLDTRLEILSNEPELKEVLTEMDNAEFEKVMKQHDITAHEGTERGLTINYPDKQTRLLSDLSRNLPSKQSIENIVSTNEQLELNLMNDNKPAGTLTLANTILDPLLNYTDMFYYDAVCRLWNDGHKIFTIDILIKYAFSDKNKRPTERLRKEAMKSIEKLRRTFITIDRTTELRNYKNKIREQNPKIYELIEDDETFVIDENLINARGYIHEHKNKNNISSKGYVLLEPPPVFTDALRLTQTKDLPTDMLKITLGAGAGTESALLKKALTERYALLGRQEADPRKSKRMIDLARRIKFDGLYKKMDLSAEITPEKKHAIKEKINVTFSEWKKKGYIYDFKFIKEKDGKTFYAVDIYTRKP